MCCSTLTVLIPGQSVSVLQFLFSAIKYISYSNPAKCFLEHQNNCPLSKIYLVYMSSQSNTIVFTILFPCQMHYLTSIASRIRLFVCVIHSQLICTASSAGQMEKKKYGQLSTLQYKYGVTFSVNAAVLDLQISNIFVMQGDFFSCA